MTRSLDIVLPCFNPPSGWAKNIISSWKDISAALGYNPGLILIDDGNHPGLSIEAIQELELHIPDFKFLTYSRNRGKGYALRKGIQASNAELVIYTDIDFPYTTQSLLDIHQHLTEGVDIVAGVRDEKYYDHVPTIRKRISRILRWMLRNFLRLSITDTQTGLKGFNQKGKEIFLSTRIDRFLFDLEFIFLASNDPEINLIGAPVQLREGIVFSKARLGILLRESFNFLWIFLRGLKKRIFG